VAAGQQTATAVTVSRVPPERYADPTRLPGVTVGDLVDRLRDAQATLADTVVHLLDLAAATDVEPELTREALALVVRTSLRALAEHAPGRTVEVRVPPFAAVQCIEGPRHTRGTPPNVVETDPTTWVELASGRLGWSDAVRTGRVRASGERADLTAYLPVTV
jgi:hypothetical protein